ncbi:hypothetical protein BGZ67_009768 [Mortierella alpina]|nr:hypothetical protein BGZ67_009768 [Mortierella alpina]
MKRVGCPIIYERARDVDQTKSIYQPDKKPYKAWPSDFKLPPVIDSGIEFERSSSLSVTADDSHFEPVANNEADSVLDADSDVEMIDEAGPHKEATDHNGIIPSSGTHSSDWQQLLDENHQALQEAIDRLRKAQANIETLQKRGQDG